MNEPTRASSLVTVVVSGIALIIAAIIVGYAYDHAHSYEAEKSITVTGSTDRLVDSDTVKWSLALSQSAPPTDQAEAGRRLDRDRATFLAYLAAAGIGSESVSLQPISIAGDFTTVDYKTGQTELTSYTASQILIVESSNVSDVGTLSQGATVAMAEKGVNLSTHSVEYYYGKLADLKLELLTDATKNARQRGEAILSGGGGKLGTVLSADTGVFQVTAVNSADLSDYGTYDTTSPRKKVTAVVHATFKLE